jgi:hypothetical protein
MLSIEHLRALERDAYLRAAQAEHEGKLSPEEREAVWAPWVTLRTAAYQERLKATLRRSPPPR